MLEVSLAVFSNEARRLQRAESLKIPGCSRCPFSQAPCQVTCIQSVFVFSCNLFFFFPLERLYISVLSLHSPFRYSMYNHINVFSYEDHIINSPKLSFV